MTTKPLVLVLGSGPRVGTSVAEKFASNGYQVITASRSGTNTKTPQGYLSLQADFTDPSSIPSLFTTIRKEFNTSPSVVIYNAAALTPPPDKDSVLSIPAGNVVKDLNVNTISAYVAAQEAVKGWEMMEKEGERKKTFIYTGNIANVKIIPVPMFLNLGIGKSASAYWVGAADALYQGRGYRFFYADERYGDGKNKGMELDGAAHAEFYAKLAEHEGDVPWHATFVKGKGYVEFK